MIKKIDTQRYTAMKSKKGAWLIKDKLQQKVKGSYTKLPKWFKEN